jgi:hypothetical protein
LEPEKEFPLTVDTNERPTIDPGHQLTARGSESRQHKIKRAVIWIVLLLVLVLIVVLVWRRYEGAKKATPAPAKITITTAAAKNGDIGVYLDAIGTVTRSTPIRLPAR